MKYFTILLLFISINCFSQIQIEKPDNKLDNNKPLIPSNSHNVDLKEYKSAEQFLGLIGKELFYLPENSKHEIRYGSNKYESISFLPREKFKLNKVKYKPKNLVNLSRQNQELLDYLKIKENYFVVDSIDFFKYKSFGGKISGSQFNKGQEKDERFFSGSVDIYTHHKDSNEIIIFNISKKKDAEILLSLSYFNYLIKKYLDKNIIIQEYSVFTKKKMKNSKAKMKITIGKVKDVGMDMAKYWEDYDNYDNKKYEKQYSRKYLDSSKMFEITKILLAEPKNGVDKYYKLVFHLKNSKNNIEVMEYNEIKNRIIFLKDFNIEADLIEERDLIKKDSLERVRVAETKLENEQVELIIAKNEKARTERRISLAIKYGIDLGETIAKNKISIGMTKEMCRDSWGEPNSINKTTNSYGTREQWVYSRGRYLYFDKEKLTTVQN
jgi:hypothetical protein